MEYERKPNVMHKHFIFACGSKDRRKKVKKNPRYLESNLKYGYGKEIKREQALLNKA